MTSFLKKRVHTSWQIAAASAGIVVGTSGVQPGLEIQLYGTGTLLTGIALLLTALLRARGWTILLAVLGGLTVGAWRGSSEMVHLAVYQPLYGTTVQISGVVSEDVDTDKRGNSVLRLKDIEQQGHHFPGTLWVSTGRVTNNIQRSDRVRLQGRLEKGFGTFAGSIYRPSIIRVNRPQPGDVALTVRNWFAGQIRESVSEPEASLGIGFLVGQRRGLPPELDTALQAAGLTHIVVASGYNLTILVRLARRLFERVSKYVSALTAASMIAGFIAVTGMSPSMSRAGLVAGLSLAAWYYGRSIHPLVLLPFAMAVTVLLNPSYAWGDVGWQLSFAAFAGVIIMAPLLQRYYFGEKKPGTVRQVLGETFSAWLWTLPILASSFGVVSNVAIIANLLILPFVPVAMLLTFIAGIGTAVIPALSPVFGVPAQLLLQYMTETARFFAGLSWAQQEVEFSSWMVTGSFVLLALWCLWMWHATKLPLHQVNVVE